MLGHQARGRENIAWGICGARCYGARAGYCHPDPPAQYPQVCVIFAFPHQGMEICHRRLLWFTVTTSSFLTLLQSRRSFMLQSPIREAARLKCAEELQTLRTVNLVSY